MKKINHKFWVSFDSKMSFRFFDLENNMYVHEEWVPKSEYEAVSYTVALVLKKEGRSECQMNGNDEDWTLCKNG